MMRTLLVANRAEIAHRVLRTASDRGLRTVAVFSEADRRLPYVAAADVAVCLGPAPGAESYLDPQRILEAARRTGADAIHPGYGFLSENAAFARAVIDSGLTWVGPPPGAIEAMGDKAAARRIAIEHEVPVVPGFDGVPSVEAAAELGFPVLIKAVAGGGGRGMRRVESPDAFADALASAQREARAAFGDDAVILERYVDGPRHVEVQIFADVHGAVIHLGERECSVQRRHQKVIEEAPSLAVDPALRARMGEAACRVAAAVGYVGAGTVEFLVDAHGAFYFLEMNTRLQVEHPVTEAITGLDLVDLQLQIAEGQPLPLSQDELVLEGWAIEARIYAEDPLRDYLPATGRLHRLELPALPGVRIDTGFASGSEISPYYDAMIAKVIATGPDRQTASRRLLRALQGAWAPGIVTNLPLLRQIIDHPLWHAGKLDTHFLARAELPQPPPLNLERGALAATALGVAQRRGRYGSIPAGFRLHGRAEQADTWRCGDQEVTVRWTPTACGLVATIGSDPPITHQLRLGALEGDVLEVELDGLRTRWRLCWVPARGDTELLDDGDTVYVHLGDGEAFVQLVPRFSPPGQVTEPGTCAAPTPGRVLEVRIAPGDRVQQGQKLVVIEAMKMEHAVLAPEAGTVTEVRIAPGDQIDEGDLLVRLEPVEQRT
ncbi:MAG TPA: ATP-grasp domain-containing protein [Deltaproteobacteria bacterium]|nr:ATP-grasp domain-containing protein [Deltaproteobacteria bacterium]